MHNLRSKPAPVGLDEMAARMVANFDNTEGLIPKEAGQKTTGKLPFYPHNYAYTPHNKEYQRFFRIDPIDPNMRGLYSGADYLDWQRLFIDLRVAPSKTGHVAILHVTDYPSKKALRPGSMLYISHPAGSIELIVYPNYVGAILIPLCDGTSSPSSSLQELQIFIKEYIHAQCHMLLMPPPDNGQVTCVSVRLQNYPYWRDADDI